MGCIIGVVRLTFEQLARNSRNFHRCCWRKKREKREWQRGGGTGRDREPASRNRQVPRENVKGSLFQAADCRRYANIGSIPWIKKKRTNRIISKVSCTSSYKCYVHNDAFFRFNHNRIVIFRLVLDIKDSWTKFIFLFTSRRRYRIIVQCRKYPATFLTSLSVRV